MEHTITEHRVPVAEYVRMSTDHQPGARRRGGASSPRPDPATSPRSPHVGMQRPCGSSQVRRPGRSRRRRRLVQAKHSPQRHRSAMRGGQSFARGRVKSLRTARPRDENQAPRGASRLTRAARRRTFPLQSCTSSMRLRAALPGLRGADPREDEPRDCIRPACPARRSQGARHS